MKPQFEEHEGQLFRMLEENEIVPLKEKDTNVLVRFITHGIIGEYVMEHWLDCNQENVPIFVDSVDSDGDVTVWIENGNEHICCPFPMFEIIGYPVVEGSAEWACYQMMKGEKVTKQHLQDSGDVYWCFCDRLGCVEEFNCGTLQIMVIPEIWVKTADKDGWQIYEEPKPLLVEATVGDLVKLRNGSYSQIVEVEDGSVFKYQNPEVIGSVALFWCDENGDTSRWGKVKDVDIIATEPLAPKGTAEWAWQMMLLSNMVIPIINPQTPWKLIGNRAETEISGASHTRENWIKVASGRVWQIYEEPKQPKPKYRVGDSVICEYHRSPLPKQISYERVIDVDDVTVITQSQNGSVCAYDINGNHGDINGWHIDRVISPCEHIVTIGCLSGTVRPVSINGIHIWFHLIDVNDRIIATIRISSLDTQTRELVESLLKAQEEDK